MVQKIHDFQNFFPFFINEGLKLRYKQFLASDLGYIYQAIPWAKIISCLQLRAHRKGPTATFSPQGKIALMILKSYTNLSDKKLIELINGSIHYQFFCKSRLGFGYQITDYKIVSRIRCELAKLLCSKTKDVQKVLAKHWMPYMQNRHRVLMDATVYEVSLRYPTDTKLLFESIYYMYKTMKKLCRKMGLRLPRTKYAKWEKRVKGYQRKRRKTRKEAKKINAGLLRLLDKLIHILEYIENITVKLHEVAIKGKKLDLKATQAYVINNAKLEPAQKRIFEAVFSKKYHELKKTIKKIYYQQHELLTTSQSPKNRIISIQQPHLRPLKRGKETKSIEIGAKVNKIQLDGIGFIDHISFSNFNESTKLRASVNLAERLTKEKIKEVGADRIYATNKNRKWLTERKVKHGFPQKGPRPRAYKKDQVVKKHINLLRSTMLEGSFGTEKEHYGLKRIPARTANTQMLCIFFGIHTKNALEIGRRMSLPP